jgi:hypothetical protein
MGIKDWKFAVKNPEGVCNADGSLARVACQQLQGTPCLAWVHEMPAAVLFDAVCLCPDGVCVQAPGWHHAGTSTPPPPPRPAAPHPGGLRDPPPHGLGDVSARHQALLTLCLDPSESCTP